MSPNLVPIQLSCPKVHLHEDEAGEALTSWLGHVSPPPFRPVVSRNVVIVDAETTRGGKGRERPVYAIVGEPWGPPGPIRAVHACW